MISPSQRPLPDNTQHLQERDILAGFEPAIPASECPQIHALDRKSYKYCSESIGNGEEIELLVRRSDYKILIRICMKLNRKLILETLMDRGEIYQNARRKAVFVMNDILLWYRNNKKGGQTVSHNYV